MSDFVGKHQKLVYPPAAPVSCICTIFTTPASGQFNVRYQDIVITDPNNRKWYGRIGSKQGYQGGEQITVSIEQKADSDGNTYNYFKRFNPQYSGGEWTPPTDQSTLQSGQQAPPAAAQQQNGQKEMRIVRGNALNAVMSATTVPSDMISDYLLTSVQFILTGNWILKPKLGQPDKTENQYNYNPRTESDDDIPF